MHWIFRNKETSLWGTSRLASNRNHTRLKTTKCILIIRARSVTFLRSLQLNECKQFSTLISQDKNNKANPHIKGQDTQNTLKEKIRLTLERGIEEQALQIAMIFIVTNKFTLRNNDIRSRNFWTRSVRDPITMHHKFRRHKGPILRRTTSRVSLHTNLQEAIKKAPKKVARNKIR